MKSFQPQSVAEQVARHLRAEITAHRIRSEMPGIHQLAAELAVNHKTVKAALEILQKEGLLVSQGSGKPRRIELKDIPPTQSMRIAILPYEPSDRTSNDFNQLLARLNEAGHVCFYAKKTLIELKMDAPRVADFVRATEADSWVIIAGSQGVLDWFAEQDFPAFALFGRSMQVDIAASAPKKLPALSVAVQRLVAMGHQRMVLLARAERRKPTPGFLEQAFLDELESQGIATGSYNLPDWEESPAGLQQSLDALFRHTPPTALFIQNPQVSVAILQHAASRGLTIPKDFSMVSMDPNPAFAWCHPTIAHIDFDSDPWLRRIVQWARNVARGMDDRRKVFYPGRFIAGGTIGPAKQG